MDKTVTAKLIIELPNFKTAPGLPDAINVRGIAAEGIIATLLGSPNDWSPVNDSEREEVKMENPNDTWRPGHSCDREGIDSPFTGEWDFVEEGNLVCHIAQTAAFRVVNPMVHLQLWMATRMYKLVQECLPEDKAKEFYWYWRWASDLQTDIEVRMCEVATLVTQNLPAKLTSLNEMLVSSMVESGFCCRPNLAAYIHDAVTSYTIAEMERTIPDFKREWLSPNGPHAPLETD